MYRKKISCTFWYIKQPKLWEERGALTACLSVCETFLYNIWDAVYPLTALLTPYLHCLDCGPYWNRHCSSASCNCPGSSSEKWKSRWGGRSRRQSPAPELKKIKIEIRACWTAAVVICFCQVKHKIWMRFYYFIYSSYWRRIRDHYKSSFCSITSVVIADISGSMIKPKNIFSHFHFTVSVTFKKTYFDSYTNYVISGKYLFTE